MKRQMTKVDKFLSFLDNNRPTLKFFLKNVLFNSILNKILLQLLT